MPHVCRACATRGQGSRNAALPASDALPPFPRLQSNRTLQSGRALTYALQAPSVPDGAQPPLPSAIPPRPPADVVSPRPPEHSSQIPRGALPSATVATYSTPTQYPLVIHATAVPVVSLADLARAPAYDSSGGVTGHSPRGEVQAHSPRQCSIHSSKTEGKLPTSGLAAFADAKWREEGNKAMIRVMEHLARGDGERARRDFDKSVIYYQNCRAMDMNGELGRMDGRIKEMESRPAPAQLAWGDASGRHSPSYREEVLYTPRSVVVQRDAAEAAMHSPRDRRPPSEAAYPQSSNLSISDMDQNSPRMRPINDNHYTFYSRLDRPSAPAHANDHRGGEGDHPSSSQFSYSRPPGQQPHTPRMYYASSGMPVHDWQVYGASRIISGSPHTQLQGSSPYW